jgi:phosphatidylserine/phosphatidylglycerophosphate/cardiolipin synthase-like enzyme
LESRGRSCKPEEWQVSVHHPVQIEPTRHVARQRRVQAHGKLTIVDGRIAALGSMAQTALSLDFRREIAVTVEEPKCVRKLKNFYRLLASGRELMARPRPPLLSGSKRPKADIASPLMKLAK